MRWGRRLLRVAVPLVVLCVAVAPRAYRLDEEAMWHDEAASVQFLKEETLPEFLNNLRGHDPAMVPFYFVIEYACLQATYTPEMTCRWLSVAFGVLTALVVYLLGGRYFSRTAGFVAAMWVALSSRHVYYSQEIRMYALFFLLAALSIYVFSRLLDRGGARWWWIYAAVNTCMMWTHLFGFCIVLIEGLFACIYTRRHREVLTRWMLIHAPLGLSLAMWIATVDPTTVDEIMVWVPETTGSAFTGFLRWCFVGSYYWPTQWFTRPQVVANVAARVLSLVLIGLLAYTTFRPGKEVTDHERDQRRRRGRTVLLLLAWLILPTLTLQGLSLVFRPCFVIRYVIHSSLGFYLLVGAGLAVLRSPVARVLGACAILSVPSYDLITHKRPFRANIRAAADFVDNHHGSRDMLFIDSGEYVLPAKLYCSLSYTRIFGFDNAKETILKIHRLSWEGQDCWIVDAGKTSDIGELLAKATLEYETIEFPGARPLRMYHVPARYIPPRPSTAAPLMRPRPDATRVPQNTPNLPGAIRAPSAGTAPEASNHSARTAVPQEPSRERSSEQSSPDPPP